MYKLFSNVVPRAFLRRGEGVLSSAKKNPGNDVESNEDAGSNSANEEYYEKVGEKNKIIKDRSYERDSNRGVH